MCDICTRVLFCYSLLCSLETGSFTEPGARLAASKSQCFSASVPHSARVTSLSGVVPGFYMGVDTITPDLG